MFDPDLTIEVGKVIPDVNPYVCYLYVFTATASFILPSSILFVNLASVELADGNKLHKVEPSDDRLLKILIYLFA